MTEANTKQFLENITSSVKTGVKTGKDKLLKGTQNLRSSIEQTFKKGYGYYNSLDTWQKVLVIGLLLVAIYLIVAKIQEIHQLKKIAHLTAKSQGMDYFYDDNTLTCTMYYTTWCPHCTKAKPEWSKIEKMFHNKMVGGKKILITKVDCEKYPELAQEQGISGYPTFKFNFGGKSFDFEQKPVFDNLKNFILSIVNTN